MEKCYGYFDCKMIEHISHKTEDLQPMEADEHIDNITIPQYMILDNDDINSGTLIKVLEYIGECAYQVFTSPSQLLEALQQTKPDIVFCNVTTRGCDARELVKNKEINIPFMFISVLSKSEERRHCYLDSGYPYVTSPLSPELIQKHL